MTFRLDLEDQKVFFGGPQESSTWHCLKYVVEDMVWTNNYMGLSLFLLTS